MSYSENDHNDFLDHLSPYDKHIQLAFEKKIEVLIIFKQMNQSEDVYLNEECMDRAIKWFTQNIKK